MKPPRPPKTFNFGFPERSGALNPQREGDSANACRDAGAILERCSAPSARGAIFIDKNEQRAGLAAPYALYRLLLEEQRLVGDSGDRPLRDKVRELVMSKGDRNREPSATKLALLSLLLAAKPENELERKYCSDLACHLEFAADRGVEPEGYASWAEGVPFSKAVHEIRKTRRAERQRRLESVSPTVSPVAAAEAPPDAAINGASSEGVQGDVPDHALILSVRKGGYQLATLTLAIGFEDLERFASILAAGRGSDLGTVLSELIKHVPKRTIGDGSTIHKQAN